MASYAVIGLGRFGMTVATILAETGMEVLAIDKDQALVDAISGKVTQAICINSTDEEALRNLNLDEMDAVILGIGSNIEESILTAAILKKIGVGMIHAKVENELHGRILELIGVQKILLPEKIVGTQLAKTLSSRNILEYTTLTTGLGVMELLAPPEFVGKTLQELALPTTRKINIIAIKYNYLTVSDEGHNLIEQRINDMPGANDIINEGDILVLMGKTKDLDNLVDDLAQRRELL
ncbi:MAG: TrkA family potassium uptake protein [Candidatus Cloacimonadaceae bacterium]|jgi:trk system potassium uptake protein TrkA|nr:TrkA family potassium uptake protein [Candidatus Cloacimonadota bacterium]MCB5258135.1 TrkA family potassium uptake protein [Candidatus Cloacimonadota bacterium]MDD5624526.1 TrkA family potassium uptake protein [Candidatus Cloacimonadota bacterium]MDY0112304.1 TrkA family potassium uptake protein [Candidatus Syntrophosphaera sp.]